MDEERQNELLFAHDALEFMNLTFTEEIPNDQVNILSYKEICYMELQWKLSGDPAIFEETYANLKIFIECRLDTDRDELAIILYPIFVRMYLELVYNERSSLALTFLTKFGPGQDPFYQNDLQKLAMINSKNHMTVKKLDDCFTLHKFLIPISRRRLALLYRYLQWQQNTILVLIIEAYMNIDIYEETKVTFISNKTINQPIKQSNKRKINHVTSTSSQSKQSEATKAMEETEHDEIDTLEKPKVKQRKLFSVLIDDTNSNGQSTNSISIVDLKLLNENKELLIFKKLRDNVSSIFTHTFRSKTHQLLCATFSKDASMLLLGFHNGLIQVWSLTRKNLKLIKSPKNLKRVDLNTKDVKSGESVINLCRHKGPVFSVSFSPDALQLLSCSEDRTIRLWSLLTWDCVFVYDTPLTWDVIFSPCGRYFVSASSDRTAKLWKTNIKDPLLIYKGHFSDVDCIQFHPNSKYIATGSSDGRIILWDCFTADIIHIMTAHESAIYSLVFSRCGKFLISGGADLKILVWNIAPGRLLTVLKGHTSKVTALAFSSCGSWLWSGSRDCTLKLWDFAELSKDFLKKNVITENKYLIGTYSKKMSPFLALHFSKENELFSINFELQGN